MSAGHVDVVDGVEWWRGYVLKKMDPQRILNSMLSNLVETASTAPREVPLLTPEQYSGYVGNETFADVWARGNIDRLPFLPINALRNEDGTIAATGPVGKIEPTQVQPAAAQLLQLAIASLAEDNDSADEVKANVSAEAMDLAAGRVDERSGIYLDNMRLSVKREGEIYKPAARDVYFEPGRKLETLTIDGEEGTATISDFTYRTFSTIMKYGITPGYNDIFAIRRSGVLELWVNGIKLVGTPTNGGTAPGEGGSITTPYIVFNQTANNAFAQELGASGFYSKALLADEMRAIAAGGTISDKSKILHQSYYQGARRTRYPNPYSTHTATIGSDVTLLDPGDYYDVVSVIDPPSIAAGAIETVTATVTGAVVGATVTASPRNALPAGVIQMNPGRVSATNTVAIDLFNSTGSPIDPPSNTWDVRVGR